MVRMIRYARWGLELGFGGSTFAIRFLKVFGFEFGASLVRDSECCDWHLVFGISG